MDSQGSAHRGEQSSKALQKPCVRTGVDLATNAPATSNLAALGARRAIQVQQKVDRSLEGTYINIGLRVARAPVIPINQSRRSRRPERALFLACDSPTIPSPDYLQVQRNMLGKFAAPRHLPAPTNEFGGKVVTHNQYFVHEATERKRKRDNQRLRVALLNHYYEVARAKQEYEARPQRGQGPSSANARGRGCSRRFRRGGRIVVARPPTRQLPRSATPLSTAKRRVKQSRRCAQTSIGPNGTFSSTKPPPWPRPPFGARLPRSGWPRIHSPKIPRTTTSTQGPFSLRNCGA